MTRRLPLRLLALAAPFAGAPAIAQTLPLPSGDGFVWERVGNTPQRSSYRDMTFDAGGTLWTTPDVRWLDRATNDWVEPTRVGQDAVLTLGPHPAGGPARADTVLTSVGTRRSTDGGVTWSDTDPIGSDAFAELPGWHDHAGRLLVGHNAGYSDDRGATWTLSAHDSDDALVGQTRQFLVLPPPDRLPGSASGRDPAAPTDWPSGRVLHSGYFGVAPSSDGGTSYQTRTWGFGPGYHGKHLAIVRRPDTHPLGPGPRILMTAVVSGEPEVSAWSSDDGGNTWARRGYLREPQTAPGYGETRGLFALPEPGESDPGAGGRALVVMGLGHLYQTVDAGETWAVVGRAPEMSTPAEQGEPPNPSTNVGAAEMGPYGRLYVAVSAPSDTTGWVWRTTEAFVVAQAGAPPIETGAVGVSVRPNPSSGAVTARVALASPSATVTVEVWDAVGRRVAVLHEGAAVGVLDLDLDTSGFAVGVYRVVVTRGAERESAAFTVVR